jgi:hypothetical protein
MVRKLQAAAGSGRVETGVVQFGNDSPGLFIRGDDCLALVDAIREVLSTLAPEEARRVAAAASLLVELAETIESHTLIGQGS